MKTSLSLLTLLSLSAQVQAQQKGQRPNIVYIMTDDHTAQMMSCYGHSPIQTPNLDRIAEEGVLFSESFVANSLSGPSRACLMTGKHSHKNGFTNNEHGVFDGSQQTMPKLMQKAGYQTALIGKWHLVSTPTGFDHYDILAGQGEYYNPTFIHNDGTRSIEKGYCTNVITDKAIDWMEKRDKERPFILFVHHKACHRDWLPELKYMREYEDQTFEKPDNFWDDYFGRIAAQQQEMSIASNEDMDLIYDNKAYVHGEKSRLSWSYLNYVERLDSAELKEYWQFHDSLTTDFKQRNLSGRDLVEWKYQRYMRDYAKVTKSLDDNVGRLMQYLRDNGMLENTLVVYTSDQGFYMGEHGWFDKRFMYEESMHTPLVMRLPDGYNRRGVIKEMVQNIDYAPTFLEMAGAPIPDDIQGESLVPLIKEKKSPKQWRDALYYHFYEYPAEHAVKRHYGVRTERYKLIHFYNDIDTWELYDLKKDPKEMHNLYGQPRYAEIQKILHAKLIELQKQYDDRIEQSFNNDYEEPNENAEIDKKEWGNIGKGIHLSWASRDVHFERHKVPAISECTDTTIYAWKGERIGLQALAFTNKDSKDAYSVCLTSKDKSLSGEAGWLRYVLTDKFKTCGNHPSDIPSFTVADMMDQGCSILLKANEVRALWTSIDVPQNCDAGEHNVCISVASPYGKVYTLNVKVVVRDRQLPSPHNYSFHLDMWQQPYSVARYYNVEPWSEQHIAMLRPYMERLGRAGQKVVSAILFYEPWGEQSNDKFQPMVETILRKDGTWTYSFEVFDKYVQLMKECGVDHQINCFSMVPWDMNFRYFDEKSNDYKYLKTSTSDNEYKQLWTSFLQSFAQHLKAKGWFEKTCIAMDERGLKDMLNAYEIAQQAVPGIKMSLAGNYHKELIPLLQDYCIAYGQKFSDEELALRRSKNQTSTVYTCCTEPTPNIFSNSEPVEAAYLPLYCAAHDFDGYLHWSYLNWTDNPMTDTRFKFFAPGDTYFFYPGNRTSVRYERLLEGVQQFEKIRIMRQLWKKDNNNASIEQLEQLLNEVKLVDTDNPEALGIIINKVESLLNKE